MLARALIVLLIVLNLGVAAWWMARSEPAPAVPQPREDGTPRLRLLSEAPRRAPTPAPQPSPSPAREAAATAATGAVAATATPVAAERCHAFGPFVDAAGVDAARARLQPRVARLEVRTATTAAAGGDWRVWLPPLADRAAAQAMAQRIAGAGFEDYYVVSTGGEANSIALGLYGSEASARRREAALQAAGFDAVRAQPMGEPVRRTWIDVAAASGFDAGSERAALGVEGAEAIDCDTVP